MTLALLALSLNCGGETNRQLFKRYENQFAEKRQQFKKIADLLPAPGTITGNIPANLSVKPVFNAKTKSFNTEIVMYDQLLDPDIESREQKRLDLLLSGDLLLGMKWTGPKNPMSESALDNSAGEMEQTFKKALACRYLIVLRPATFIAPVAVSESEYKPGVADIEALVVDLESNKVVGSSRFTASSANKVEYVYKQGESRESRLEAFAYSTLYTEARQKLEKSLADMTGGEFVFER